MRVLALKGVGLQRCRGGTLRCWLDHTAAATAAPCVLEPGTIVQRVDLLQVNFAETVPVVVWGTDWQALEYKFNESLLSCACVYYVPFLLWPYCAVYCLLF